MLFIVRFTDKPDSLARRQKFLPAHLEWLEQHRHIVRVAGSLRPEPEAAPVGAIWVVEASGKTEIESLIHGDPFWVQGVRERFEVLHWSKAFPERRVEV